MRAVLMIIALAACGNAGPDKQKLAREATAAMTDYRQVLVNDGAALDDDFGRLMVNVKVPPGRESVPALVEKQLEPRLKRIVAACGRAVSASDAYGAAVELDAATRKQLDKTRKHCKELRDLHARLAKMDHAPTDAEARNLESELNGFVIAVMRLRLPDELVSPPSKTQL